MVSFIRMCVSCVSICAVIAEATRGCRIPWNECYKWLWSTQPGCWNWTTVLYKNSTLLVTAEPSLQHLRFVIYIPKTIFINLEGRGLSKDGTETSQEKPDTWYRRCIQNEYSAKKYSPEKKKNRKLFAQCDKDLKLITPRMLIVINVVWALL